MFLIFVLLAGENLFAYLAWRGALNAAFAVLCGAIAVWVLVQTEKS